MKALQVNAIFPCHKGIPTSKSCWFCKPIPFFPRSSLYIGPIRSHSCLVCSPTSHLTPVTLAGPTRHGGQHHTTLDSPSTRVRRAAPPPAPNPRSLPHSRRARRVFDASPPRHGLLHLRRRQGLHGLRPQGPSPPPPLPSLPPARAPLLTDPAPFPVAEGARRAGARAAPRGLEPPDQAMPRARRRLACARSPRPVVHRLGTPLPPTLNPKLLLLLSARCVRFTHTYEYARPRACSPLCR
jgi:hypothetical protein